MDCNVDCLKSPLTTCWLGCILSDVRTHTRVDRTTNTIYHVQELMSLILDRVTKAAFSHSIALPFQCLHISKLETPQLIFHRDSEKNADKKILLGTRPFILMSRAFGQSKAAVLWLIKFYFSKQWTWLLIIFIYHSIGLFTIFVCTKK